MMYKVQNPIPYEILKKISVQTYDLTRYIR